jgi:peptidoglycan/xylan/chitin deacetylase (PgdA/CDA1 family)
VDHSGRDQRRAGGSEGGAGRGEDLERTVALRRQDGPGPYGGQGAPAGALDKTLAVRPGAGQAPVPAQGGAGARAGFDGAAYGRFRASRGGGSGDGSGGDGGDGGGAGPQDPQGPFPAPRPGLRRRVLFAAGGLALVGGCGVAAASKLSGARSSGSPSASAFGPGSAAPHSPSPSASASPSARAASASASAAPSHSPGDLSSSSAHAASSPGAGGGGHVPSAPEYYVHAGPKAIALTLDDGPHPVYTPQVLALLERYGIKATFCMIGRQIAANRSLVREVAAAGHMIVNHTWDHADQSKLALAKVRSEMARTSDALAAVGVHPSVFRAPYGAWSATVFQACAAARLRPLDWSVDPRDWSRPGTGTIVSRIMHQTRTGSIILEHDGGGDRSQTVAALKIVLPQLLNAGYRFTGV